MLQPILCRHSEVGEQESYVVIAGKSRVNAAIQAGLERIPIMITSGDPLEISLSENLFRQNLTAVEEAEAVLAIRKNMTPACSSWQDSWQGGLNDLRDPRRWEAPGFDTG